MGTRAQFSSVQLAQGRSDNDDQSGIHISFLLENFIGFQHFSGFEDFRFLKGRSFREVSWPYINA